MPKPDLDDTYLSVVRRPIELHVFGSSRKAVMVMAGVHGDEPRGVEVARRLIEKLTKLDEGELGGTRVVVMPLANPDGHALGTRKNANGIDINRNFPTKDFGAHHTVFRDFGDSMAQANEDSRETSEQAAPLQDPNPETSAYGKSGKFYGGETAASEPETQAIMTVISRHKPRLIVSLHEPLACVNYNGPSIRIARRISKLTGLPVTGDVGYPCPGSMGTYYGFERRLPLITLELPQGEIDTEFYSAILLETLGVPAGR